MTLELQSTMKLIDDQMIVDAYLSSLEGQGEPEDPASIRKKFNLITSLTFSYKQIYKIHGLRGLEGLQVLKLDNNLIKKIENLSELKALRSLDLSFN